MKSLTDIRVVLAEDEYYASQVMEKTLKSIGYQVVGIAEDGGKAVEMTCSLAPDVVLMDIAMPEMDGMSATRQIMARRPTPVIVISAYQQPELVNASIDTGIMGLLTKPVATGEIERAVAVALARFEELMKQKELVRELTSVNAQLNKEIDLRQRREAELQWSKEQLQFIAENVMDVVVHLGPDNRYIYVSPSCQRMFGFTPEELLSQNSMDYIHPDDRGLFEQQYRQQLVTYDTAVLQYRRRRKVGDYIWVENVTRAVRDPKDGAVREMICTLRDISERKQTEEKIRATLKEKEILVQEIHHRVKNNMNVLSSLLKLQADSIPDESTREVLQESRNRIEAMAMIHETLYQRETVCAIEMRGYLIRLVGRIVQNLDAVTGHVDFDISADNVALSIRQAGTLGLIVNELVSNALKYAFPDGKGGTLTVALESDQPSVEARLIIADDGVGPPTAFDWRQASGLGLRLVRLLAEDQLKGSVEMDGDNGCRFTVCFSL